MLVAYNLQYIDNLLKAWSNDLPWKVALVRLGLAALLGGLVGLEREVRGRQAGFRTNLLVSMGCALAMLVSISFAFHPWPHEPGVNINIDPARVAYGVMGGIGFLGAGVIIKHSSGGVRGLTTAAALWCVAAIGLACGMGLYVLSVAAAVLVILSLWTLDAVEHLLPKVRYRALTVRAPWGPGVVGELVGKVRSGSQLHVRDATFQRVGDLSRVEVRLVIAFSSKKRYFAFERKAEEVLGCELVSSQEA
jgi:putative Mg2+ transporter-C (MgtC) family protein